MSNLSYILYFTVTILLISCNESDIEKDQLKNEHLTLSNTHTKLPLAQFVKWVGNEENQLYKSKEISEMKYQLFYMPKECLTYMELKDAPYTEIQYDEVKKHYTGMTYFNFRIELKEGQGELLKYDLSSAQQYNDRINYMSFEMQKDIFLVQGSDTLIPGLFHFERIFEVAPFATVMLAFDNKKFHPENEFTIVYNDRLFKKGYIKYNYKQKQLIDLPNISGV